MSEVAEHETDSEDVGAPVPADDAPDDETDEEEAEAPEEAGEPAGEPSEAVDPKYIERVFDQLDREAGRHAKRLGEIMGEEAQALELCPCCGPIEGMPNLVGFVLGAGFHDEAIARMRTALGLNDEANLKPDPHSHPCEACDAWGVVGTGSHVPNMDARTCDDCKGRGYIMDASFTMLAPAVPTNGVESVQPANVPAAIGIEPPEAEALRRQGYAVIPPIQAS